MSALWWLILPPGGIVTLMILTRIALHGHGPVRLGWATAILPGSAAILRELARQARLGHE